MATERRLALAALALFAGGCTNVNRCRSQTILVSVTLDAATAQADTLEVDVAIDGSSNRSTVTHAAGSAAGTIEVRFPSGYPTGKSVSIRVVALQAAVPLGDGTTSVTAPAGCTTAMVAIASGGTSDQDLAATNDDLAGSSPGADLACPSSVEDCFNGVDDNCDGLVDCADPQCTATSECVPDPGTATTGTLSATTCPSSYPTATPLYSGLNAGTCASGTCTCNGFNGTPTCAMAFTQQGSTITSCSLIGTLIFSKTNADGCIAFSPTSSTTYYTVGTPQLQATCNPPSGGTPLKNAPTWTTNASFCSGATVGGGCTAGNICVPKAANHCIVQTGSQVACTVPGYTVQNTTPFFSGYDDSARSCACSCALSGTCSTNTGFGTGGCTSLFAVGAGCQKGLSYDHAQISGPANTACTPSATSSGSTSTAGFERTLCCTN